MRAFILVIDGLGIGEMPDARLYGDRGSNTLKNIYNSYDMDIPTLISLGLYSIDNTYCDTKNIRGAYARMEELSKAKDTTVGHWEIAGVVTTQPFPTFPDGFPPEFIQQLEDAFGVKVLLNKPYSGTEALKDYGAEHIKTGCPIVYTSGDSVLQIAVHTDVIPLAKLYEFCSIARKLCVGKYNVGRIIARPFTGEFPFVRTDDRKDYSVSPPSDTLLNNVSNAGLASVGVGKIEDIFNFSGLTESYHTHNNAESLDKTIELAKKDFDGLVFVNLIDTDMLYGHRRDVFGYAQALEKIDIKLAELMIYLKPDDVLYVTADHGNDPCHKEHTDHTREYTPLLVFGDKIIPTNLGTIKGFDAIADTIREQLGLNFNSKSLWDKLTK
ncbi:MAG: phosphopentomutase [Clostridia bacterium]